MSGDYREFLRTKSQSSRDEGFELTNPPEYLFDFQKALVEWACLKGRAGIFADCGLGKTPMMLAWADAVSRETNGNVLILAPLAVSHQIVMEGEKFGVEVKRSIDGAAHRGISVTNYERLDKFDSADFKAVVCDECFPAGTKIDTPNGMVDIEKLHKNAKILSAAGIDEVVAIKRREVFRVVKIKTAKHCFTSSGNHPFFTKRGWVAAQNLKPGDTLLESRTAMRLVCGDVSAEMVGECDGAFLRSILLSEMADEYAGAQSQSAYAGSCREAWQSSQSFSEIEFRRSQAATSEDCGFEPDEQSRIGEADDSYQDEAWNASSMERQEGRQWDWINEAGTTANRCSRTKLDAACYSDEYAAWVWTADALQGGCRKCSEEDSDRGGRDFAFETEASGCQEGCFSKLNRVDSVEILEQEHPELDQYRDEEGRLYFYDIEVARHPSFSVNGCLVHNSSIIKHWSGKTQKQVTRFLSKMDYRLLCTATPAPNDFVEMGTSAEALGWLTHSEMLATFFRQVSDDEKKKRAKATDIIHSKRLSWRVLQSFGQWTLKAHAFEPFWKWVSSWARACRKPSDLGDFDDARFILPELIRYDHTVTPRTPPPGFLFTIPAFGLNQERAERRRTLPERTELVADLVKNSDSAVVWCHLNSEGDMLEREIADSVQVKGSQHMDEKEELILAFLRGEARVLVTKAKIAGLGLNMQHCAHVVTFVDHSYEKFYQCIRRCFRFGQKRQVRLDVIATEGEINVRSNMERKEAMASEMFDAIVKYMNQSQKLTKKKSTKKVMVPTWL